MRVCCKRMAVLAAWGWAGMAMAQVEMTWSLEHGRTVLMEPVRATVQISNYTGTDLDLTPNGNAVLRFDVEDQPSSPVAGTGRPLVQRAMIIPNGETRDVDVNLLDAYRIVRGQSYMLTPVLEFGGTRFMGKRLPLEVQPGLELLSRKVGMPSSGESREVSLRLISRDRTDHLFFRIDNSATGFCLGVYDLGRVIRFFVPQLEQDREGVFHVLHQNGPDRFFHSRFDYDGRPLGVTVYAAEVGSLQMVRDDEGEVAVTGGTAYEEDNERPGVLTAPALPPSNPYATEIGELPLKGRSAAKEGGKAGKSKPATKAKSSGGGSAEEEVMW